MKNTQLIFKWKSINLLVLEPQDKMPTDFTAKIAILKYYNVLNFYNVKTFIYLYIPTRYKTKFYTK